MLVREDAIGITRAAINRLKVLERSGERFLCGIELAGISPPAGNMSGAGEVQGGHRKPALRQRPLETLTESERHLVAVENRAMDCRGCSLSRTRKNVVFSDGSGKSGVAFIGEAPGRDEDLSGTPFVGLAGKLLTRIINSIPLKREDVYIANVIKCRPPLNRNPLPGEIEACTPFLIEQLELLEPKIIVALGRFSAQFLADSKEPISALRGNIFSYRGIKVIPTYHPAAVLRNPGLRAPVWDDVQVLQKELGLPVGNPRKNIS